MSGLLQDLRYALRLFGRNPGTTAVAVLSLALAIGPNSMLFSVVDRMFLRPTTVEGIENVYFVYLKTAQAGVYQNPTYADLPQYQSALDGLADCIAQSGHGAIVGGGAGAPEVVGQSAVSGNYFTALGSRAALGRTLVEFDQRYEGAPPAYISNSLWQRRYSSDPDIVGKNIIISYQLHRVVGVAPPDYRPPIQSLIGGDIWTPLTAEDPRFRAKLTVSLTVRLRPGVHREQVEAALTSLASAEPRNHDVAAVLRATADRGRMIVGAFILALVSMVLLIACANVAGVLLAQGEARRREFAMRLALGADRARLLRQLLVETLLLSSIASALGLVLSEWLLSLIPALTPSLPMRIDLGLRIDGRVLAYTLLLSFITTLAAGLLPALRFSRPELIPALKGEPGVLSRSWFRGTLIVGQIAFAQFLLLGTGLLVRTYLQVERIRPGFDPDRQILFAIMIPNSSQALTDHFGLQEQLQDELRAIPGVRRVSVVQNPPLSGDGGVPRQLTIPGLPDPVGVQGNGSGPEYLTAIGSRILRGHDFTAAETDSSVIVNEQMARRYWGEPANALGRFFQFDGRQSQVVGVVETGKYNTLIEDALPYFYYFTRSTNFVVIEAAPGQTAAALAPAVRETVRRKAPGLTINSLNTLQQQMSIPLFAWRSSSGLFGVSALLGIFLSAVGLYGVVSHSVTRRTHEIGIRMALGARPGDVRKLVFSHGFVMVAGGAVVGTAAAVLAARVVARALYHVSPADPVAICSALLAVALVAFLALHLPARRATRVDPMTVLRD
ncbi:MAG: ADOP family duplicated permease [Candidatus Sulfopaludibacter sp.]|nr:ADOP family duplicated permease [Candidatus Sulfopaludibacter sp.]